MLGLTFNLLINSLLTIQFKTLFGTNSDQAQNSVCLTSSAVFRSASRLLLLLLGSSTRQMNSSLRTCVLPFHSYGRYITTCKLIHRVKE